jgi:diguanylate cyclase (GGDEF)-like protein
MAELKLPKLKTRVRFPSPAPATLRAAASDSCHRPFVHHFAPRQLCMSAQATTLLLTGDISDASKVQSALQGAGFDVVVSEQPGLQLCDAVLWLVSDVNALQALSLRNDVAQLAFDSALVVVTDVADQLLEADLINLGAQAVVLRGDSAALPRHIRQAVLRKSVERSARTAYATDLATGLPHQTQLLEHMTQLLALREREPAPMVLMVIRVEGYASAAARLGGESANVLRRKVAVRLRSGLRASDVVASLGHDAFGVLLGRLESRGDGERVAAKLVKALQQPFTVAGQACSVATAVGMALYPEHGKDARSLMARATAQAGSVATMGQDGRQGLAGRVERGDAAAANDDAS